MTKAERQARYRERRRIRLASPSAIALAASSTPDEQLDGFALAVRHRLMGYLADLGGADGLAETKVAQVRSLVEAEIVLEPLTRDVLALAQGGQLWSLRTRKAAALMTDWLRLKEHRDRLLMAVGLDAQERPDPADTLEGIVAGIVAARPNGSVAATVGSGREQAPRTAEQTDGGAQVERAPARRNDVPVEQATRQAPEPVECRPASLMPDF